MILTLVACGGTSTEPAQPEPVRTAPSEPITDAQPVDDGRMPPVPAGASDAMVQAHAIASAPLETAPTQESDAIRQWLARLMQQALALDQLVGALEGDEQPIGPALLARFQDRFAAAVREAPVPPGIDADEEVRGVYVDALEQQAEAVARRALALYDTCQERAPSEWRLFCAHHARGLRAEGFD